ncbi:MAG: chaperone modulator CbpM [Candidatus Tectimicrobiota bacterium]
MSDARFEMVLCRLEHEQFTLEGLAARAGLHPAFLESLLDYGLLEPLERAAPQPLFDVSSLERLRVIERLRRDLGVNLAGIAVILDLRERLTTLQQEIAWWRARSR